MEFTRRAVLVIATLVSSPAVAQTCPSGQVAFGQSTVEPAFDLTTGDCVFLLTPDHAPFPSKANERAQAPLYLVAYPTASSIPADELNCRPDNCNHVQALPPPVAAVFTWYEGGALKGHDHLVGVPRTGGDFNVAWHVYLVLFTKQGVGDGAINDRLTTWAEIQAAIDRGDVAPPLPTPIIFNCSIVSETVYDRAGAR